MKCLIKNAIFTGLALAGLAGMQAHAGLPAGISGSWFNPEQSGHGLSVQILDPERALVFWYAYDAEGKPYNLYIEGQINGRRIDGVAYAPAGMRWGSFDPQDLNMPVWGEVGLDFSDCNNATLNWEADSASFGSGSMQVVRLAGIQGLDCAFDVPEAAALATGAYSVEGVWNTSVEPPFLLEGVAAVDPSGKLWAMTVIPGGVTQEARDFIPGPTSVHASISNVLTAKPESEDDAVAVMLSGNYWAYLPGSPHQQTLSADWAFLAGGGTLGFQNRGFSQLWRIIPSEASLLTPLTPTRLLGAYTINLRGQFFNYKATVHMGVDSTICIDFPDLLVGGVDACRFSGRYWLSDGDAGFLDFELSDSKTAAPTWRGRGWLHVEGSDTSLVFVGDNGQNGLAFRAR